MKNVLLYYRLKLKNTYTKLVLSYIVIAVIITAILSLLLFNEFMNTSVNVIESDSRGKLNQNVNHMNLIRSRIFSLGQQMSNDSDIIQGIYGEQPESITDKAMLVRKLYNIIDSDSIIHSIFLFNSKSHDIFETFGVEQNEEFTKRMLELLENYNIYDKVQFLPSRISYQKVNGEIKKENILTIIFSPIEYADEEKTAGKTEFPSNSAILINLHADMIQGSIASSLEDGLSDTIIIDKAGNVIFDSMEINFGTSIGDIPYIRDILDSDKTESSLVENIEGKKSLVVYKNIEAPGWTFINVYTYESLFKDIYRLRIVIIFICIGVVLAAVAFSNIAAKSIYSPFKKLIRSAREVPDSIISTKLNRQSESVDDVQYLTNTFNSIMKKAVELESSINDSIPMIKKTYLKELILGKHRMEARSAYKMEDLFKNLYLEAENGCYSVVVFSIDDYKVLLKNKEVQNDNIVFSSIEMLIIKAISMYFICEPIDYENNYIYLLLRLTGEKYFSLKNKNIIEKIQMDIQKSLGYKISSAIGIPVNSIDDIHLSYSNAVDMIKYRLVYGYGSFFSYDMPEMADKLMPVSIDKRKEKLIQNIKIGDINNAEEEIDNIINDISECQYDYIMLTLNQLMLNIVKSVQTFFESDSEELNFNNIYSNLNTIGTLEEMKEFFMLYCSAAIDKIEKKRMNRISEVINEITGYILENYNRYDISAEGLAERVNLSPGYFGKLFNEHTGKSVNEYIVSLRLERAKELLSTSNISINNISGKVGFNNPTYFMTVFKKAFGMTPNQYRTENKLVNSFFPEA